MNAARNPWNVKKPGSQLWEGQDATDKSGTAVFLDGDYGVRACARNLESYWLAGHRTIRQIVTRATPPDDTIGSIPGAPQNETMAYARGLAEHLGLGLDDPILPPRQHPEFVARFLHEVSFFEGSGFDHEWPTLLRGVALWYEDFAPAASAARQDG